MKMKLCFKLGEFSLILLALSSFLSACSSIVNKNSFNTLYTPSPLIEDGGFISGKICGPPCFFGIIPGVTTKNDAITLLQSRGLYQDCTEIDTTKKGGGHIISCNYLVVSIGGNGDLVSGISFRPSEDITVAQVIAKYGQPTVVSMLGASDSSDRYYTAYMDLCYDQINTVISLIAQENSATYEISPTTLVGIIEYDDQEEYQSRRQIIQSWNGYGKYEERNP